VTLTRKPLPVRTDTGTQAIGGQSAVASAALGSAAQPERPQAPAEAMDLVGILSAIEETAYIWDISSDRIEWESNAAHVLSVSDAEAIDTGAAYQMLIAPEHLSRRSAAIFEAPASDEIQRGTPYRL